MITAENVSYQEIIKDISFEIPDHGVVGLVGPNGSGKAGFLRRSQPRCVFSSRPTLSDGASRPPCFFPNPMWRFIPGARDQ